MEGSSIDILSYLKEAEIDHCVVRYNSGRGIIRVGQNAARITNNLIEHNLSYVFSPVMCDSLIEGNTIQYNQTLDGRYEFTAGAIQSGGSVRHNIIRYNTVEAMNAGGAICSYSGANIEHNLIENNSAYSTGFGGYEPFAAGGIIASNSVVIRCNTIRSNEAGVSSGELTAGSIAIYTDGYGSPQIEYNNFQDNSAKYEIVMGTFATYQGVIATNNWWETTDEDLISQRIYDYYDDFNLSKVTYQPMATAPIPEAP